MLVLLHGWTENWLQSCLQVVTQWKLVRRKEVSCPIALVKYNQYMGGVDHGDKLRGYYQYHLKCRKFYKYIAYFLFEVSVTNSFILFVMKNETKICLKTFREKLALELIGDYCS